MKWSTSARVDFYLLESQTRACSYTEGIMQCGILFIVSLLYEYSNLEYAHIHGMYRVNQARYGIRFLVAASQEYVVPLRQQNKSALT